MKARDQSVPHLLPKHNGIFRVLICRLTHSLGNTVLVTSLIGELTARFPGAEIDIATRSPIASELFIGFSSVRCVFRLPAHAFAHPAAYLRCLRKIRSTQYDLVIDPAPRSRTGRGLLRLAKGRIKLGFADRTSPALTYAVASRLAPSHAAHQSVFLVRHALGGETQSPMPNLDIVLSTTEKIRGKEILRRVLAQSPKLAQKPVIGLFANATGKKLLPSDWWSDFGDALRALEDRYEIVEIIPASGKSLLASRYPAYFSTDVRRLASVLSALSTFVTCDCGVMHLACATSVPVIALFSVTDPREWGPLGQADRVVDVRGRSGGAVALEVQQLLNDNIFTMRDAS